MSETELVNAARAVILDMLQEPQYADSFPLQLGLAKWVIENIWTPDADKQAA